MVVPIIDLKRLIIGRMSHSRSAVVEVNINYLKELASNDRIIINIKEEFVRYESAKRIDTKYFVYIYLRNRDFCFIRNLQFRSRIYPLQADRIIKKLKLKAKKQSLKNTIYV